MTKKFLIITTNHDRFENIGFKTGLWLSELATFYNELVKKGYDIDIASPQGGKTPIDPQSLIIPHIVSMTGLKGPVTNTYKSDTFAQKLEHTLPLNFVKADKYDGIYLTGGHGVMYDYPHNQKLQTLISHFYESGKVVSAVCHGTAGLLNVTLSDGTPLLYGRRVTGYSWFEEKLARIDHAVPFNLEKEIKRRHGIYSSSRIPFNTHVMADGPLITGQNPKSTKKVALTVLDYLQAQ